jgi:hypothetical protein
MRTTLNIHGLWFALAMLNLQCITPASQMHEISINNSNNHQEENKILLFIGNSLTYTHNLPSLVQEVGRRQGLELEVNMITKPNYALIDHWKEKEVQRLINSKKYNYVIIQQGPSSQLAGRRMLIEDGKKYTDLCAKNGCQVAYFMVWPSWQNAESFEKVILNHEDAAAQNGAILCPVGREWKNYIDKTKDLSYYGADRFHPSLKGSKVAANIIYHSLFE